MRVKWTKKALLNVDDAVNHIANDNPIAANKVARKIWENSQMLALQPGLGRPGRVDGTRELIIANLPFILPYTRQNDTIYILRVIHTSMIWPSHL
ncbi:MAG: type II toxin-antitoxin system mRNA interferase toxin, RelE/StbE family [Desulfobulbaceae bacterium]|nr:MAG: type II toxin-antitoxin system mRNA interferase toxin, RelE/StbE family [Desulfobulbaceae bacterium]